MKWVAWPLVWCIRRLSQIHSTKYIEQWRCDVVMVLYHGELDVCEVEEDLLGLVRRLLAHHGQRLVRPVQVVLLLHTRGHKKRQEVSEGRKVDPAGR